MAILLTFVALATVGIIFAIQATRRTSNGDARLPVSVFKNEIDRLIFENAQARAIDPVLLKALCKKESSFNPMAVNPETKRVSESELRNEILGAADGGVLVLKQRKLDPSIGIAQVRTSTANDRESGIRPVDLFNVSTCLRIASEQIAWLESNGVTLPNGIDSYNMGLSNYRRGKRNISYQQDVLANMREFAHDFDAAKGAS